MLQLLLSLSSRSVEVCRASMWGESTAAGGGTRWGWLAAPLQRHVRVVVQRQQVVCVRVGPPTRLPWPVVFHGSARAIGRVLRDWGSTRPGVDNVTSTQWLHRHSHMSPELTCH
jgi:hypothetical protein